MTTNTPPRVVFAFLCLAVLLAWPGIARAQSSFIVEFDRTGDPGTTTVDTIDPLTLEPTTMVVQTGAFYNPCTYENIDVRGSSTISLTQTVDRWGMLRVTVNIATSGTGRGWMGDSYSTAIFTESTYSFSDNQKFSFRVAQDEIIQGTFQSDFSDKFMMKGARSIDNWMIRTHFRIKVIDGQLKVFLDKMSNDPCKG